MTPLALFVYARADHAERTLAALLANRGIADFALTVFCDGARGAADAPRVAATRAAVRRALDGGGGFGKVEIIESPVNRGLAASIIAGVDRLLADADRIVVMEDDLVTAPSFLEYMTATLDRYADRPEVFSVTGWNPGPAAVPIPADYAFDVYFNPRSSSWGWGTWKDRWRKVDFGVPDYSAFKDDLAAQLGFNRGGDDLTEMLFQERERNLGSWSIRMSYAHFRHHAVAVYPCFSQLRNIGLDGSGEHCGAATHLAVDLDLAKSAFRLPGWVAVDERIMAGFRAMYARPHSGLIGGGAAQYWAARRTSADQRRIATIRSWLGQGAYDKAKQLLDLHLTMVPEDPEAVALLGALALAVGSADVARTLFRTALHSHCDQPDAWDGLHRAALPPPARQTEDKPCC